MNAQQLTLDDYRPAANPRLVELIDVLRAQGGWITRRQLEPLGFGERELRELAECDENADIFSYPGSPGYKLWDYVTLDEFQHCTALHDSARKLENRYVRYQRRFHRSGGIAGSRTP